MRLIYSLSRFNRLFSVFSILLLDYTVYNCDIYQTAWRDDGNETWVIAKNVTRPIFCTGAPITEPSPYQPTCNESWPIRVEFNDGSRYANGSLKTCTINMAESRSSANTRHCLDQAFNGFENGTSPDWIVYITAGYNARILWYHDFSDALIKRYGL